MLNSSSELEDRRDIDIRADIYLSHSRGGDGSFTAAVQPANHVRLEKKSLFGVELLHKEILFSLESAGFSEP